MAIPTLTDYKIKKEKGLISIQKINEENYAIGTKYFSPEDGVELPMQVAGVTMTEVDKTITDKQSEIAELKAFKVDLTNAI